TREGYRRSSPARSRSGGSSRPDSATRPRPDTARRSRNAGGLPAAAHGAHTPPAAAHKPAQAAGSRQDSVPDQPHRQGIVVRGVIPPDRSKIPVGEEGVAARAVRQD